MTIAVEWPHKNNPKAFYHSKSISKQTIQKAKARIASNDIINIFSVTN